MPLHPDGENPCRRNQQLADGVRGLRGATGAVRLAGGVVRADGDRLDGASAHGRPIRRRLPPLRHQTAQSSTSPRRRITSSPAVAPASACRCSLTVFDEAKTTQPGWKIRESLRTRRPVFIEPYEDAVQLVVCKSL